MVVTLVGALVSSCGLLEGENEPKEPVMDITMKEVAEKADVMLDATLAAFVPEVEWTHSASITGECNVIRNRTVMTIISEERRGNFLGMTERFWKKSGYEITSVNPDKRHPAIFALSPEGLSIRLTIGDKGQAFFEVRTPCVKPSDVPPPASDSNGEDYSHNGAPYPNVRSDFWSAGGPAVPAPSPST
ncbi:hypothetical protein [Streptomyces sp. NPDC048057]|uniref:hypothetical protein n=1 Tax=Streptomyces sp. NPDC048057 TaxID=3155628 RepID=UPI0033FBC916